MIFLLFKCNTSTTQGLHRSHKHYHSLQPSGEGIMCEYNPLYADGCGCHDQLTFVITGLMNLLQLLIQAADVHTQLFCRTAPIAVVDIQYRDYEDILYLLEEIFEVE